MIIVLRMIRISLLASRSKDLALLDNITICDRVVLNFDGSSDYIEMETGQYIHHLDSKISRSDPLFLVHFGAPEDPKSPTVELFQKTIS